MSRNDEPSDVVHAWTFTMQMAEHQGLTRNRNWQQMPMQMLRARALTFGLRGTFPEAVSGIYSADEIADNQSMNDDERAELSAEVLGEKLEKIEKKTKVNMSTGEVLEAPAAAQVKTHGYNFDSVDDFWAACKSKGLNKSNVNHALLVQKVPLEQLNTKGLSEAFYLHCCTPVHLNAPDQLPPKDLAQMINYVNRLRSYVGLSFYDDAYEEGRALVQHLSDAAWHESLMLLKGTSGGYKSSLSTLAIDKANAILKQMKLGDWSQYDRIQAMIKDPSSFDDSSNIQPESIPF